jgi:hypothetical protein
LKEENRGESAYRARDQFEVGHLVLIAFAVYFLLVSGGIPGVSGGARLRHPVMPLLMPFAVVGLDIVIGYFKRRVRQ